MELLEIGKVLKPQGLRGELKIEPAIYDMDYYKTLKSVLVDGKVYDIKSAFVRQGYVYITFKNFEDINLVEEFRNKKLKVKREDAPKLDYDEFFIVDMIGINVVDENGHNYGEVIDIDQFGAADVYTIKGRNGVHTFPFLKDMVISVDIQGKTLLVKEDRIKEVLV